MNARIFDPIRVAALAGIVVCANPSAFADDDTTQTIVMVRHGEKPVDGLGQLTCQGLNRALALPRVIESKYGRPVAIFAPDPAKKKNDRGTKYDYVRPLATIELTAIYFGLPVDASIGFKQDDQLIDALLSSRYRNGVVVVAWEHAVVEAVAKSIVKRYGGDASSVPRWESPDYDSIYVVRIARHAGKTTATFQADREGLDGQPAACPGH
ncbi:type I hydrophobic transmembrane region [Candidatus Burkholderia verschuerenii]|uniref:Type I hydrophobic transmembrane region n=1 Tax=Candidatus Burkholderia verschuerenii TaxID=242163 RepID=A0A0L0MDK8_9BURK|nr:histidine phosphatase family protein [Candidatus Burkholderia verschuerenii]KND60355.1 type I hydrophobic transmembrane region [Candidatus Burkholderia verschuerenii]